MGIGASEFHQLYRMCFPVEERQLKEFSVVVRQIKELVLSQESIEEKIDTIRKLLATKVEPSSKQPIFELLKARSFKVNNGSRFWEIFESRIYFKLEEQNLYVDRIKLLQEDLKKHHVSDLDSLNSFLRNEFCELKPQKASLTPQPRQSRKDNKTISYFHHTKQELSEFRIPKNIYSNQRFEACDPEIRQQLINIRADFSLKASREEKLITEKLVICLDSQSGKYKVSLEPYHPKEDEQLYPYVATLHAMAYQKIQEKSLRTISDVSNFGSEVIQKNGLFKGKDISQFTLLTMWAKEVFAFNKILT